MEREQWCEGCGVTLQTENPEEQGYVPASALEREHIICRRCYRIRHYNELAPVEQDPSATLRLLEQIAQADALVVQVIDLFDISGSWIPGIHRHIGNNPLLILGNKVDLFPKSIKHQRLKEWVQGAAKDLGVKPVDVVLTSAAKGTRIDVVAEAIEKFRDGRDVFVIGTANAGKSTFINRLLKEFGDEGEEAVTTSPYPGTTLDAISIPLGDGKHIIDMPGVVRKDRMSEWVDPKELKQITPDGEIKPKVYQLSEGQTLFFGGLARIDFVEGKRQSFICYLANGLYIHRTKLEKATEIWERHRGELLSPPKNPDSLPKMVRHSFVINATMKEDIVISGLGWISVGSEKAKVDVWAPEGVRVELRSAVI
ncbi:ribosome biogenesis GTPase YqeH [Marininema halotolerans]|uniref:ribosome biogenesis GTPase YqeH n=1 Tax=Marininema halotolerans TaxID=1155944 RepID=UPI000B82CE4B|nr:ribosome biogenesis GTPase YqeH [Marininema halotolerans]